MGVRAPPREGEGGKLLVSEEEMEAAGQFSFFSTFFTKSSLAIFF